MSNDLIHRREVLSVLEKIFETYRISFCKGPGGFADAVAEAINDIPTAHDVDKVVERLGESKEIYPICGGRLHVYAVRIDKAVNAVKEGFGIPTMAAGQEGGIDDTRNTKKSHRT